MISQFEEIQNKVFSLRPALKTIAKENSRLVLKDYIQNRWQLPGQPPEALFLEVFESEAAKLYGPNLAKQAVSQLAVKPLVSSIDHHGIWNHPIFVNSSLIYSLYFKAQELAIVLPTESVSLNNTSSWSGSLLYHNQLGHLVRHSFLPDRIKTLPVFAAPAISRKNINRFVKTSGQIFPGLPEVLDIKDEKNFSIQASKISFSFWQAVFPGAPKLVYVPLETLVSQYLLKVFQDPKHVLSRLVLTKEGRELWQKHFGSEHTFMFWGIDKNARRQALNELPEKVNELFKLIEQRKIYASSPLCFLVLLKAGLACVGGFTQTTWLTQTKAKFVQLLGEMSNLDKKEILAIQNLPTANFAESSLAWLNINKQYSIPTGVDLFLSGKDYYSNYLNLAEKLTMGKSLELMMPTIYEVVVPKAEQKGFDAEVLQKQVFEDLNIAQVLRETGI